MILRVILTALALLLATTAHAEAGFVAAAIGAVASAVGGVLAAGGIGATLLKVGFAIALQYGVGLLQRSLQKKSGQQQQRQRSGVQLQVGMGDDSPMAFTVGTYATAGTRKYINVWGQDGETPNAYLVDVIQLGDMPLSGLVAVWCNGEKCTLDTSGSQPAQGWPVLEYRDEEGKDHLWVRFFDGTQTTASTYLVSRFGADPNRPWTSQMIGRGCPYAVVTALYNPEMFSGQPYWLFELGPTRWYDVRKDSTAGGSGAHRWNSASTWEPTNNPAVIIYNLIRGVYFGNPGTGEWVYGGQNLPAFRLPAANWMAAANECDAAINEGDGPVPQFQCGMEIRCDTEPLQVIEELLKACSGRLAEVGGIFKLLIGMPPAAVYSFGDDDIVITEGQSFQPFPAMSETHNAIEATYPEPLEMWNMKDAPPRYDEDYEAADGGRRLATGVSFEACPYGIQVQRLMKAMLEEERRFRVHQITLPPEAWHLEPNDEVSWTSERNGYIDKKFRVVQIDGQRNINQVLVLREIDPSDYDWSSSEKFPTSVGYLGRIIPAPQVITGFGVEPTSVLNDAGNAMRPALRLFWSWGSAQAGITAVAFEVRHVASGTIIMRDRTDVPEAGEVIIASPALLPLTDYEVRARFVAAGSRRKMAWSIWLPVTTLDVDAGDLLVYLANLQKDIIDEMKRNREEFEREMRRLEDLATNVVAKNIQDLLDVIIANRGSERVTSQIFEEREARQELDEAFAEYTLATDAALTTIDGQIAGQAQSIVNLQSTVSEHEGQITATAQALIATNAQVDNLTLNLSGLSSAFNLLESTVSTQGDQITVNTQNVQAALSQINDVRGNVQAQGLAINQLSSTVSTQGGQISAMAQSLTAVTATANAATASGLIRFRAVSAPAGVSVRFSVEARVNANGAYRFTGFYLDLLANGSSRFLVVADRFIVSDGSRTGTPFVYEGSVLKLALASIVELTSGVIRSPNNKFRMTLDQGRLEWFD